MAGQDDLVRYHQKRDFTKTPEPTGMTAKKAGNRYLIQKHAATRLHYDFRLELDGVLKSWAVTRGPSLDPHDKRLAVEVEDHPLAYGRFEGTIPPGQYGGGTVMLWDEGNWEPIGDPHEGLKRGKLEFLLHGKRLNGEWTLVRMKGREKDKGRNNWLLIKHSDSMARIGDRDRLLTRNVTSVISGRTMERIAAAKGKVWQSREGPSKATITSVPKVPKKPERRAVKESRLALPAFKSPQLATLASEMPEGKDWVHEIKFDGYRALAYLKDGNARIYTRSGLDWTHKFRALAEKLEELPVRTAIMDGEIIALDEKGISSFKALQNALTEGRDEQLQYYVFDLLHLDGKDITRKTLLERKAMLEPLLKAETLRDRVFYSEHFKTSDVILERVCNLQLEGIISKRADAPYSQGRGTGWLKTKCHKRQEFVIGGFTLPAHAERGLGAVLIGYYNAGKFVYAGKVGTGFDNETSLDLRKKLNALAQETMAFESVPGKARRGAHWVRPKLVCEVEFTEWTPDGRLRHPSFQGLREDKAAVSIRRDIPVPAPKARKPVPAKLSRGDKHTVGGIAISHPERVLYLGTNITKAALAEYYLSIADLILPHVKQRPLSLLRCPEGTAEECFFQRHIGAGQSPYLHDMGLQVKGRKESYLMIKDVQGLLTLTQWGVIELHPWGCLADKPEKPDRIIFDLDPAPALPWEYVMEGAREIRVRMQEFGLESFIKTTGGKGLHVVIPMTRAYGWPAVKAFARAVAESMENDNPQRYIAKASKSARKGKIFVDYLRNDLTSTAVAPYSARARERATVAMPISWNELKAFLKPDAFTVETVPAYLKKRKADPWQDFFKVKQKISARHLRALKITPE